MEKFQNLNTNPEHWKNKPPLISTLEGVEITNEELEELSSLLPEIPPEEIKSIDETLRLDALYPDLNVNERADLIEHVYKDYPSKKPTIH
jgi:hypothetical protein